jgi:two-component system sensor histidine kinase ChiS
MTRILFIDDDVLALQLMSKVTNLLGYQAILTTSPRSALDLVMQEKPELVMVDMLMDEMDGPEFVRLVRGSPDVAHVPVLIYSAGTGMADEEQARSAGANGFLRKPVGLKELSQAIHAFAQ